MSDTKLLISETHQGQVCHLTMNSPENLNAMDLEMASAFRAARAELEKKQKLRLIVIRGEGRAFSAGGDLSMLRAKADKSFEQNKQDMLDFYKSFLGLRDLNVPLLVCLHGHVVGAGFCFAAACDLRLAEDSALLAAPFTRLALHPGMGGSFFLPRAFGHSVATELMISGRRMNAEEALQHGFVAASVSREELSQTLDKQIARYLKSAPEATKRLLASQRAEEKEKLEAALQNEATQQAHCYASEEFLVGVEALQKKESPPWCPADG